MWTFKCFSIYCPRLLCTQKSLIFFLPSFFPIRNRKEGVFCPTFIWIWPLPFYSTMSPPNSQVYIFIFTLPLYISSDVSPSQPFWILGRRTDQIILLLLKHSGKEISRCIYGSVVPVNSNSVRDSELNWLKATSNKERRKEGSTIEREDRERDLWALPIEKIPSLQITRSEITMTSTNIKKNEG